MSATGLSGVPERPLPGSPPPDSPSRDGVPAEFDPLKLCIFATVALLTWIFGPLSVLVFASMGLAGYWRARRAGLTRSKCYLRDTRLVLAYLAVLVVAAVIGIALAIQRIVA
jgi:hypothetical protein